MTQGYEIIGLDEGAIAVINASGDGIVVTGGMVTHLVVANKHSPLLEPVSLKEFVENEKKQSPSEREAFPIGRGAQALLEQMEQRNRAEIREIKPGSLRGVHRPNEGGHAR